MRVLLDENIDWRVRRLFDPEHEVSTVAERGWKGKKNGELLRIAESEADVFVTMDRGIEYQQNLNSSLLAIVVIHARSNRRADVEPAMQGINKILARIQPGEVIHVE